MINISGTYRKIQAGEERKEEGLTEIFIENLIDNVISIEFSYKGESMKLKGVLHRENGSVHIYISEKYTEKFFIHGSNLKTFAKSGIHGSFDHTIKTIDLHLVINQFDGTSDDILFRGRNEGGIYPEKNLRLMKFL